ncbi:helix-turn-helix domain-containing protein [Brevibacillus halotolerans]|uniref:helix-turn-helix domain-containing protein n=1 Tax=Brevibacillus halotolerans TaxID=1507437 RepID=UPI0015EFA3C2|nr:helix-turn-helix transcriptional regulator [Brevibacillus halotolerans]MBA4532558.1 helix-turn-helix transcriptional regulator [Brevibacillus halotolerans]
MSFGKYLKTKRKEKNLSMNKLGELTGITAMYISQLEGGKRVKPSIEILKKFSESLEIPYEDLMVAAGYIDPDDYVRMQNERDDIEWSLIQQEIEKEEQKPLYLDFLLDSKKPLFFKDRLLTKEEKSKIRSLIEIVLKD